MALPNVIGEFGVVKDPEVAFSGNGTCWVKIRGAAKDRTRDANGEWKDGDPTYIDLVVFGKQAEHIADSVVKGDTVMVVGVLQQQQWEQDGQTRTGYRVRVSEIGVSVRWSPAKTPKMLSEGGTPASKPEPEQPQLDDPPPF